jgi:hypothetical protein
MAVVLVLAYAALELYSGGQKDMLTVESRGLHMITALGSYKRENGSYPDSLNTLVPKFAWAVSKCPNGQPMGYRLAANEYVLSCQNVVFKYKPYSYDSRSRAWGE